MARPEKRPHPFPPWRSQSWLNSAGRQQRAGKSTCVQLPHCHDACCLLEGWEGLERQLAGVPGGVLQGTWQHFRDGEREEGKQLGLLGVLECWSGNASSLSFISQSYWVLRWSSRELLSDGSRNRVEKKCKTSAKEAVIAFLSLVGKCFPGNSCYEE